MKIHRDVLGILETYVEIIPNFPKVPTKVFLTCHVAFNHFEDVIDR